MINFPKTRAVAELDTAALVHNFRLLRARGGHALPFAVVKANAYGHGVQFAVPSLVRAGCRAFAVASLEEAVAVRLYAPAAAVLILGYTPPHEARVLSDLSLTQTVFSAEYAEALDAAAKDKNCRVSVHFKLDGGMTRLGFAPSPDTGATLLRLAQDRNHLCPRGIFTHFPCADADPAATGEALAALCRVAGELRAAGLPLFRHAAASAALLLREDAALDATRPGIALYGIPPVKTELSLQPVLRLAAPLVQLHEVPAGTPVGYGGSFVCARRSRIGTVPIGYADGIPRALSGFRVKLYHGGKAFSVPIAGRVCMDQTMLDLTDTTAAPGDEISFFEDLAAAAAYADTIPYELLTGISARVARVVRVPETAKNAAHPGG